MSGIFITVWDNEKEDQSQVLNTTSGGYPHVTLAYTGQKVDREQLVIVAAYVLKDASLRPLTLTNAYVNSFVKDNGEERHDVLLALSQEDVTYLERCRGVYIRSKFSNVGDFTMRDLHVTHAICSTREEAQMIVDRLNRPDVLPYRVEITGVTIN